MNWNRKLFWGITLWQLTAVLLFYIVFLLFYDTALTISQSKWSTVPFSNYFFEQMPRIVLDYSMKLLFTIPVWYLLFVRLRTWPFWQRVLLHIVLLPLFIFTWQTTYYFTSDQLNIGRMAGSGSIWDTYITMLFYCVQFGLFHAYQYYSNYQKQREEEAKLREVALQSELSALKAQINPHFLYNVFNTISASVPPEQEHTREMLAELADLFRYQLQASRSEQVTVREEVAFVQKYLALEQARFGDRLRVHYAVSDSVLDEKMPPMILQPLVENSIKHGISPLIEGGDVTVTINRQNGHLYFDVTDTGVGLNGHRHQLYKGVGLSNTKLRLEKMYGGQLQVTDNEPRGLSVAFQIPS
ncbi:sensor histidine kinase [Spirosoma soli]|uniref:Sensor histidine kinase n=1 Tax=Spirosoma soli TaxID=1770529 RepID=A0ABW5MDM3_9BACT